MKSLISQKILTLIGLIYSFVLNYMLFDYFCVFDIDVNAKICEVLSKNWNFCCRLARCLQTHCSLFPITLRESQII